jgi:hypothetical protein
MNRRCWLFLVPPLCLAAPAVMAQPTTTPEPILRATLDPSRAVVGQPVMLHIDLLAPNYMTAPPVLPELQLRNAVTRDLGSINMSEQHDGITYAGVRHEFAIHPQEPGSYAIADQKITVTYAAAPPASRETTLALPRLAFDAYIPEAARTLDPFVAATSLTLRQSVDGVSPDLKTGDAVVRTLTIEAKGIPAMLLPPLQPSAPAGLAAYPDQPSLQDHSDRRTDELTATRVDRVTYMLQKPGDYVLPAIELAWWNLRDQKVERARTDQITLHVVANPALQQGDGGAEPTGGEVRWRLTIERLLAHWPMLLLALAVLIAAASLAPRTIRALHAVIGRRRAAYASSEAAAFAHLRAVARGGNSAATYFALLAWLERFAPVSPTHTLKAFREAAQDPALDRDLTLIEGHLFAATPEANPTAWSARRSLHRIASARRRLLRRQPAASSLPLGPLNPPDPYAFTPVRQRAVAR